MKPVDFYYVIIDQNLQPGVDIIGDKQTPFLLGD